ncbi:MAG: magnesium/cobalt transporter CorA [Planctomycetota bacterium]
MPMQHKRYHLPGTPPGTLISPPSARPDVKLQVIDYKADHFLEHKDVTVEECLPYAATDSVTWINVDGLGRADYLEKLGAAYQLHPLALEDALNTGQRPKVDEYEHHLFVVVRTVEFHEQGLCSEQVSFFIGKNFLITIQEQPGDPFEAVRARLRKGGRNLRQGGPDFLAYALIDAVIDSYFPSIEQLGERIERIESELLHRPEPSRVRDLHRTKRDLLELRRILMPMREAVAMLERTDSALFKKSVRPFMRDCYDHTVHVLDMLETYREMGMGLMDLYLSSQSNRLNQTMKQLTVVGTIFMPITFLTSVYGMNFHNMPELGWRYGYLMCWVLIALVSLVLLALFWKKRWL